MVESRIPEEERAFVEKAKRAAARSFARGLFSTPDSPRHPRNIRIIGELWRLVRQDLNITAEEVESRGINKDDLSLFESGLLDPKDYRPGFIDDLGRVLDRPDLVAFHKRFFGLDDEPTEPKNESTS